MAREIRELLIALLLVLIAGTALATAWEQHQSARVKASTLLGVSALERALLRAILSDPLSNGPYLLKVESQGRSLNSRVDLERPLTLDRGFKECASYPSASCGYKIRLSLDSRKSAFGYEVSSAFAEAPLSLRVEGPHAIVRPGSLVAPDGTLTCDPNRTLGVNGYSSESGLSCVLKPQQVCKNGSLPKALRVVGAVPRIEFVCGEPSKEIRCPANYSLSSVDTRTLDADMQTRARCIRTTQTTGSPLQDPPPAPRISGRVCPFGYKSDSSCSFVNIVAKLGNCGQGAVVQPVPGKIEFVQNTMGGFADCAVRKRKQSCGAEWSADVHLKVQCVLEQPETINVR